MNERPQEVTTNTVKPWTARFHVDSFPAWFRPSLLLGAWVVYVLAFFLLYPLMSRATALLATLPVTAAGYFYGLPGGLAAGVLSFLANTLLLNLVGHEPGGWDVVIRNGGGPGTVGLLLIGGIIGRLSDLTAQAKRNLTALRQAQKVLKFTGQATAGVTGSDFFCALVRSIASALQVRFAVVATYLDSPPTRVRTLALWTPDGFADPLEYDLAGTPCAPVVAGKTCIYPANVSVLFPEAKPIQLLGVESYLGIPLLDSSGKVNGHLAVLDTEPMVETDRKVTLLEVFAARTGAELERQRLEEELTRANEELEIRVAERTEELQRANKKLQAEITDRKEAQEALRKSEESLLLAQEVAHFGSFERNLKTNKGWWSDEMYRILGVSRQECEPTFENIMSYVHPEDLEPLKAASAEAIVKTGTYRSDYRIIRPSGECRTLYCQVKIFVDESGTPIRTIGTLLDITELKKLEQQLLQSQKMEAIGRLAGGVAHDFNNILTGIVGFAELLSSQLPDDPKIRGDLSQVQGLAERAKTLTRQLLLFSREQPVQERVLNLNTLIEKTLTMLRRIIGEDVHLKFVPDPELGNTRADQSQLGQVFLNLAVNARDAMPEGGKLTVETANVMLDGEGTQAEPGPYVTVTVTDTGSGMDTQTQQKIFDPFFTTKEVGQGTGLGLSTVHGIVKQHGGAITVSSEPDKGTTFKIYFPRVEAPVEELPAEVRQEVQPAGGETVLVVEDEKTIRILIQRVLEIQGYQVFCAGNAGEAEQIFARQVGKIDLLLTDVVMPGDSGPKLYKGLAVKHPLLKALFISGYTDQGILRNDLLKPDMPFLQKPFEPSKLVQKVREVLDKRTQGA